MFKSACLKNVPICNPHKIPSNIAIENGPFIVDLPIKNGDFPEGISTQ